MPAHRRVDYASVPRLLDDQKNYFKKGHRQEDSSFTSKTCRLENMFFNQGAGVRQVDGTADYIRRCVLYVNALLLVGTTKSELLI